MSDLTADAPIRILGIPWIEKWFIDTSAANKFYKGQPVLIDQSADTLNATPFVDALVVDPADVVLGIALEGKTVVLSDPETTELQVLVGPSVVGFKSAVFTTADIGKKVYMSDSSVLSVTAADNPELGTLFKVEDGYAYVRLVTPVIPTGA
jgi:hypothetical protein